MRDLHARRRTFRREWVVTDGECRSPADWSARCTAADRPESFRVAHVRVSWMGDSLHHGGVGRSRATGRRVRSSGCCVRRVWTALRSSRGGGGAGMPVVVPASHARGASCGCVCDSRMVHRSRNMDAVHRVELLRWDQTRRHSGRGFRRRSVHDRGVLAATNQALVCSGVMSPELSHASRLPTIQESGEDLERPAPRWAYTLGFELSETSDPPLNVTPTSR